MAGVTIRYWAAARAAAGVDSESVEARTLAEALAVSIARHGEDMARVLGVCSFVIDGDPTGTRLPAEVPLADGATVEALPPFAGG